MPWRELVAPAVALAEEGMLVDWYAGAADRVERARVVARSRCRRACSSKTASGRSADSWTALTETASRPARARRHAATHLGEGRRRATSTAATWRARWCATCAPRAARSRSSRSRRLPGAHASTRSRSPTAAGAYSPRPGMTGGPTLAHALHLEEILRPRADTRRRELRRLCARARRGVAAARCDEHGRQREADAPPAPRTSASSIAQATCAR